MRKIRYAVAGLGHITQVALLPSFKHARNSELVALFSEDPKKLKSLGRKYGVTGLYSYEQYEAVLSRGEIDAIYLGLPNHMHQEYAVRAANCGVHVLCEKPMAVTSEECEAMITAARENQVKLMIAYRLHFEESNLRAIELIEKGKLGEPRFFESVFSQFVQDQNIRLNPRSKGGGALYDMGVYCINAARYLFKDEPRSVVAISASGNERKFKGVEETISVIMKFPGERLATFTTSFGTVGQDVYRVLGTKGELMMKEGYGYAADATQKLTIYGKKTSKVTEKKFKQRDQFGPELAYFSDCILNDIEPEPNGVEGLADIRIIEAIYRSIDTGQEVEVESVRKRNRPGLRQEIHFPKIKEPKDLVDVQAPSKKSA